MYATVIPSTVKVSAAGRLPNGVHYLELPYNGTHEDYNSKPVALAYEGRSYVRCSHNSDSHAVTYRTDFSCATVQA